MAIPLAALWRFDSSRVPSNWEELVQQVDARGAVAITTGSSVELVALSPEAYQALFRRPKRVLGGGQWRGASQVGWS